MLKHVKMLLLVSVCMFALIDLAWAQQTRWYVRATLPQKITIYGYGDVWFDEARADITVQTNTVYTNELVAFYLALSRESTDEWVAAGYVQTSSGYYIYMDKKIQGHYYATHICEAVLGQTYSFRITGAAASGYPAYIYIDGDCVAQIDQSTIDGWTWEVVAESSNSENSLDGYFSNMQVGFWYYDSSNIGDDGLASWVYRLTHWHDGYTTISADVPYSYEATVDGGLSALKTFRTTPSGGGSRERHPWNDTG